MTQLSIVQKTVTQRWGLLECLKPPAKLYDTEIVQARKHWMTQDVYEHSLEWDFVNFAFCLTMKHPHIDAKVTRIQKCFNSIIYAAFETKLNHMKKKYSGSPIQNSIIKFLFHGTLITAPETIIKSEVGIDPRYAL